MDNRQIIFKNHPVKSSEKLMRDFPAQVCYTNDKLTAQLVFEISDCTEAELAGLTASIMIFMKDGSFFQDSAVIDAPNKKITYVMLENQVAHAGDARASLALTGGSQGWGGPDRNFTVISDLGQRVATEVMIKDWTMLTAEARAYLDDAQAAEAARAATFGQWADTQADWAAAEAARVNDFSSKADKTYTDTELAKKADKADTYTKTEVDTKDATKADKLMAKNLVINGDFSQGATGWELQSDFSVENSELKKTGTASYLQPSQGVSVLENNLYYLSAMVKNPSSIVHEIDISGVPASNVKFPANNNTFVKMSKVFNNPTSGSKRLNVLYTSTTGDGVAVFADNLLLINLTSTFGAGNEPTKEQMDRLLAEFPNSWFDGTQEILPLKMVNALLNEKANKVQEAWQTPTLLNGVTVYSSSTPMFFKDNFGIVRFKGRLGTVTNGQSCFTLPAGYRPAYTFYDVLPINNASTVTRVQVDTSGNFFVNNFSGYVDLAGLSFLGER